MRRVWGPRDHKGIKKTVNINDYWYWCAFLHVFITYPIFLWPKPLGPLCTRLLWWRCRQETTAYAFCHRVGRKYFNKILSTVAFPLFCPHLGPEMITPYHNLDTHTCTLSNCMISEQTKMKFDSLAHPSSALSLPLLASNRWGNYKFTLFCHLTVSVKMLF